jgi:hypothetical protein
MILRLILIFSAIIGFGILRSCNVMIHARNYSNANLNTNIVHGNDKVV